MTSKGGVFVLLIIICAIKLLKSAPTPHEVLNDHNIDQQLENIILNEQELQVLNASRLKRNGAEDPSVFVIERGPICEKGQVRIKGPAGGDKCVTYFKRPETNDESLLPLLNKRFPLAVASNSRLFTSSRVPEHLTTVEPNNFKDASVYHKYEISEDTTIADDEKKTTKVKMPKLKAISMKEQQNQERYLEFLDNFIVFAKILENNLSKI